MAAVVTGSRPTPVSETLINPGSSPAPAKPRASPILVDPRAGLATVDTVPRAKLDPVDAVYQPYVSSLQEGICLPSLQVGPHRVRLAPNSRPVPTGLRVQWIQNPCQAQRPMTQVCAQVPGPIPMDPSTRPKQRIQNICFDLEAHMVSTCLARVRS